MPKRRFGMGNPYKLSYMKPIIQKTVDNEKRRNNNYIGSVVFPEHGYGARIPTPFP